MLEKAKLLTGIITSKASFENNTIQDIKKLLTKAFGRIDYESPLYPFDMTNYYEKEMGKSLHRIFYSFVSIIDPEQIIEIKFKTIEIEKQFSQNRNRQFNIDPGYIDFYKLVLPSTKQGGHKLYAGKGIYLDIVLLYDKGWRPFIWTFPDFTNGRYDSDLDKIRSIYKKQFNSS